jgi:EAL domain-containing protein (putative c-di-GMP-specific phosphodiesterase class I)
MRISVNVSAMQLHQPGFVAEVEAALAASGVAPGRLELEITETALMRDTPDTRARLDALIARGVRIALDDFGTGYSALAYLARVPHHRIKLDRGFVQDLGNPATARLVRTIVALARRAGVGVTAEGVEHAGQLAAVRELGFTHAQGFALAAPAPDPLPRLAVAAP